MKNFSQDVKRCTSVEKSNVYCSDWMRHQETSQEESYLCRCSITFPVGQKNNGKECLANARLVSLYARRFGKRTVVIPWFWFRKKKWYSTKEDNPRRIWGQYDWKDVVGIHLEKISQVKSKGDDTRQPIWKRLRLFSIIVSANQLSLYGAVEEICEEFESLHERRARLLVMGQSHSWLVLSAIKTEVQHIKIFYCNNMENE